MQRAQALGVALGDRDVDVLAADHAVDAGGGAQLAQRREHPRRLARLLAEEPHRLGEEAVAGEDRDVLAVA